MVNIRNKPDKDVTPRLRNNFNNFLTSLGDVLIDITALEVNTMIVEEITANKFIPWEAYRDIYLISPSYLESRGIHSNLRPSYLDLRKKLELEYCLLLLAAENSENRSSELREYSHILSNPRAEINAQNTILPNPLNVSAAPVEEINKISILLENGRFLRSLRKLYELKVSLNNQDKSIKNLEELGYSEQEVDTDIIYAQSVIQLDGDIINRYHQKLFEHKHKDLILEIHKQGAISGQKHWHGLLAFVVDLVESLLHHRGSNRDFLNRN